MGRPRAPRPARGGEGTPAPGGGNGGDGTAPHLQHRRGGRGLSPALTHGPPHPSRRDPRPPPRPRERGDTGTGTGRGDGQEPAGLGPAPAAPGAGRGGSAPRRSRTPSPAGTPGRGTGTPAPGAGTGACRGAPAACEGRDSGAQPRTGDAPAPPGLPPAALRPAPGGAGTGNCGGSCAAAGMERPVSLPRGTRPRARHYYEGFVEKRGPGDQGYRRVWAGLRGLQLAFYSGPQDQEPLELLDLGELVTVQAKDGLLILRLRGQEVTMKMKSWEMQEMWRGFILTMAKMKMPPDLALLPGHISQLLEALREEQQRRGTAVCRATPVSPTTPVSPITPVSLTTTVSPTTSVCPATAVSPVTPVSPTSLVSPSPSEPVPSCFFQVTRAEAELLLELSAPGGNLLLRPGGHGQGVSVTTRQELSGRAVLKHYRVKREPQGYLIDLETPHRCSALADVVQFFVRRSEGGLRPLEPEYSSQLELVPIEGDPAPAAAVPRAAPRRGRSLPGLGLVPEQQLYMNDPGRTQELLRELHRKLQQRRAP
ncbi:signal-transducing adaptor protein 2 [Melozone crissalis]|uniref:signal-transducing adaptor protein 2 n=1 Tax=Melozone crissalis TaxID=40204 RepID=UPI0023DB2092|nr:signal-transducing adaptor protein 2 [Melozone crissalis]